MKIKNKQKIRKILMFGFIKGAEVQHVGKGPII